MAIRKNKEVLRQVEQYINVIRNSGIGISGIYLFGSCASGKQTKDSDIDIAVFYSDDKIDKFEEDLRLMRLRRQVSLDIEPHSFAYSDLINPDPFVQEILEKGLRVV